MKSPHTKPLTSFSRRMALTVALSGAGAFSQAMAKPLGALGSGNGPPITVSGLTITPPGQQSIAGADAYQFTNKTSQRYWVFAIGQGSFLNFAKPSKVITWYLDDRGSWQSEPTVPAAQITAYLVKPDQTIALSGPAGTTLEFQTRPLTRDE